MGGQSRWIYSQSYNPLFIIKETVRSHGRHRISGLGTVKHMLINNSKLTSFGAIHSAVIRLHVDTSKLITMVRRRLARAITEGYCSSYSGQVASTYSEVLDSIDYETTLPVPRVLHSAQARTLYAEYLTDTELDTLEASCRLAGTKGANVLVYDIIRGGHKTGLFVRNTSPPSEFVRDIVAQNHGFIGTEFQREIYAEAIRNRTPDLILCRDLTIPAPEFNHR